LQRQKSVATRPEEERKRLDEKEEKRPEGEEQKRPEEEEQKRLEEELLRAQSETLSGNTRQQPIRTSTRIVPFAAKHS